MRKILTVLSIVMLAGCTQMETNIAAAKAKAALPDPQVGMTLTDLQNNTWLGNPDRVNRTATATSVTVQLVYTCGHCDAGSLIPYRVATCAPGMCM